MLAKVEIELGGGVVSEDVARMIGVGQRSSEIANVGEGSYDGGCLGYGNEEFNGDGSIRVAHERSPFTLKRDTRFVRNSIFVTTTELRSSVVDPRDALQILTDGLATLASALTSDCKLAGIDTSNPSVKSPLSVKVFYAPTSIGVRSVDGKNAIMRGLGASGAGASVVEVLELKSGALVEIFTVVVDTMQLSTDVWVYNR